MQETNTIEFGVHQLMWLQNVYMQPSRFKPFEGKTPSLYMLLELGMAEMVGKSQKLTITNYGKKVLAKNIQHLNIDNE